MDCPRGPCSVDGSGSVDTIIRYFCSRHYEILLAELSKIISRVQYCESRTWKFIFSLS